MRSNESGRVRRVRAEEVLAILRDEYRWASEFDPESMLDCELTFESSVHDWRQACDLVRWRALGLALNQQYYMSVSADEWRNVLEPARQRTLRAVCDLIAAHGSIPEATPARYLGAQCAAATAFFDIRANLRAKGLDITALRPSDKLQPYVDAHPSALFETVRALAPGRLPLPQFKHHLVQVALARCVGVSLCVALAGWLLSFFGVATTLLVQIGVGASVIAAVDAVIAGRVWPVSINWGSIVTFGDLATAIADSVHGSSA